MPDICTENLIIGAGLAGMSLALRLAEKQQVVLMAKGPIDQSASSWAQGGIASVTSPQDSFEDHIKDTLKAGAGLCHGHVVEEVVRSGPEAIQQLIDFGVDFTKSEHGYHLHKEGGHSARRVFHVHDVTGREIVAALVDRCRRNPHIRIVENQVAVDLITTDKYAPDFSENRCVGAYALDPARRSVSQIRSNRTYLCTGGHGKVYLYTSNPDAATGDGLAMGWRAGCKVANLEFMQFHPTCLFVPAAKNFLISEAVRGEGGIIRNHRGEDFTKYYDERGSMASRDIVARAIDFELKKSGESNVYLDLTHIPADDVRNSFPNIYRTCLRFGIDIAVQQIPVVPAAHYSCGGLVVDRLGRTSVRHLYAIGEVACTGLHGGNRLASNSLLEAIVYANKVADHVKQLQPREVESIAIPPWSSGRAVPSDEQVMLSHSWDEIRRLMWNYVGIVRSDQRLRRAYDRLSALRLELDRFYWDFHLSTELIEVRNLAQVAWLIVRAAMARKESRGIHFNLDYPQTDDELFNKDTIIR